MFCFLSGSKCTSVIRAGFSMFYLQFHWGREFPLESSLLWPLCVVSHYYFQDSYKLQCRLLVFINMQHRLHELFLTFTHGTVGAFWSAVSSVEPSVPKEQQNRVILSFTFHVRCAFLSPNADHIQQLKTFFFSADVVVVACSAVMYQPGHQRWFCTA